MLMSWQTVDGKLHRCFSVSTEGQWKTKEKSSPHKSTNTSLTSFATAFVTKIRNPSKIKGFETERRGFENFHDFFKKPSKIKHFSSLPVFMRLPRLQKLLIFENILIFEQYHLTRNLTRNSRLVLPNRLYHAEGFGAIKKPLRYKERRGENGEKNTHHKDGIS